MELLDLETRRLRNAQIRTGLAQYADLATDFQDVIHEEENKKVRLSKGIPVDNSFYGFINKLNKKYNIKFKYFDKN